ncbi:MAG TPA: hypothetical protein VGX23_07000 [Actinocrinis sp.]|nr:hypothetical protein [Actinocrinis sp.]
MGGPDADPWSVRITQTDADFYYALWIRDSLEIAVERGPLVPGHLTQPPPSHSDLVRGGAAELAAGWQAWWSDLARAAPAWDCATKYWDRAGAPYFDGLAEWPRLQNLTRVLWNEADHWFTEYKRITTIALADRPSEHGAAARAAADKLGHPIGDVQVDLVVVPVEGDVPLEVTRSRYIVPQDVYDHPDWHNVLVDILVRAH